MSQIRPWQAALFVVALLVLGGSLAWSILGGEKVRQTDRIYVADISTGDRFIVNVSGHAAAMYPEKNPETGEYNLWPIYESEDGGWVLEPRALAEIRGLDGGDHRVVDLSTGAVRVSEQSPRKMRPGEP